LAEILGLVEEDILYRMLSEVNVQVHTALRYVFSARQESGNNELASSLIYA